MRFVMLNDQTSGLAGKKIDFSQLDPNKTYKLKIEAPVVSITWVPDIAVTTGLLSIDVQMLA